MRSPGSLGIANYCDRLASALDEVGFDYVAADGPQKDGRSHFHLGNSSRRCIGQIAHTRRPYVLTLHDVIPRDRRLMPAYRLAVWPLTVRRAGALVVHSQFAARMVMQLCGVSASRVRVIPLPATIPTLAERSVARRALGWEGDERIAVLPGVLKSAKLVGEAISGASGPGAPFRLVLAGRVLDQGLAEQAQRAGVSVLASPSHADYERAIVAADAVIVLRDGSVGETNGPLLDALGAGRAVVATPTGSIPEVAGRAAMYVEPDADSIRSALLRLADQDTRTEHEQEARRVASRLSPTSIARAHVALFEEVFGV